MAATQEQVPLKSIKDVAEEQAHKASALVAEADALAAKSGRTRQEELQDLMMARLTEAAITRERRGAAIVAYKHDLTQLETFISANSGNPDPQRIILNLAKLMDRLKDELRSLQREPV